MKQNIIAYVNYGNNDVHIGEHNEDSKSKGVNKYKYQADYAKRNNGAKGSARAYQSGFMFALMNTDVGEWFEIDYGMFDPAVVDVKAEKNRIADQYENMGFRIISANLDADYKTRNGKSKTPARWARISANLPRPNFMKMCEKMFFSSGIDIEHPLIQRTFNDVYHWVIDKDMPDRTKADVRDYFVNAGLLP